MAVPAAAQQPQSTTWQRVLETQWRGEVRALKIADNGDIVVAGFVPNERGGPSDGWVSRLDPGGNQLWSRRVGGNRRDEVLDLALSPDGGILVTGWWDFSVGPDGYSSSGFAVKLNSAGEVLWNVTLSEPGSRTVTLQVEALTDGGALVAGHLEVSEPGGYELYLTRFDTSGQVRWTFDPTGTPFKVPAPPDVILPDGRVARVAVFAPSPAFDIRRDGIVEVWWRHGLGTERPSRCVSIDLDSGLPVDDACRGPNAWNRALGSGGASYAGGAEDRSYGPYLGDAVFRKFDAAGEQVWERVLTTPGGDGVNGVAATPDGGVVGVGYALDGDRVEKHNRDALVIKLDAEGNEAWRRTFGGDSRDEFTSVAIAGDGSIIVGGYTGSQGAQDWAPWVLRLNSSGELEGEAELELRNKQR